MPGTILIAALVVGVVAVTMLRTRRPFITAAAFLVALGIALAIGGSIGATECRALIASGGRCDGPDLFTIVLVGGLPVLLAVPLALYGLARHR